MRVLLAPDKFKGCLTAAQVARAMAEGARRADSLMEIDECPMADGGEGTVDALVAATGGKIVTRTVTGPLPRMKVEAPIGILGDGFTAVLEMASASGLHLLKPDQLDPTRTTTYGTGELLREAARLGAKRIIVGIGGSATVDGGVGAAQAWGCTFTLDSGATYREGGRRLTGGDLPHLRAVVSELPLETQGLEFIVACDVGNPLTGPDGAAAVFGPQKGATPEQVVLLDHGLDHLAHKMHRTDLMQRPGAGAAGGLGFGMMAFFGATLRPGIDLVVETLRLRERLKGVDLCLTGEGRFDEQSAFGKTPVGVARLCKELGVPCVVVAGAIGPGAEDGARDAVTAVFAACNGPRTLDDAMSSAAALVASTTSNVVRLWRSKS
jgi:glycerate 2-kinase